jgi:hypothetical protein
LAEPEGWAVYLPKGQRVSPHGERWVVEIGPEVTENLAWQIALGWPMDREIERVKQAGGRAFRCRVVELDPDRPVR